METNINEEDEDVVIQGSALHVHLSNLGYTDFESVSIPKRTDLKENKHYLNIDVKSAIKKICIKIFSFYSWITQERSISKKQLNVILNAEVLLTDHFSIIDSFVTKSNDNSKKIALQEIIVTGAIISSTYFSIFKHKILPMVFASSVIGCVSFIKYLRFYANRNLQNLILTQNKLSIICKESMKIIQLDRPHLQNVYDTCFQQFSHFLRKKIGLLQLLTGRLIKFMENTSSLYYQYSLSIAKLLPPNILNEESFTKFEDDSFKISDEINYQTLKKFYHIYLLVQSEMLYLLAVAYNSKTWTHSYRKIPEMELALTTYILNKHLNLYKSELTDTINAYRTCEAEPVRYTAQGRAKWHDPTVQLDLASYKLQLAYNQIFSIFKDIDDCIIQDTHIETADSLLQRLNKAFKEVDTAKNLAEFVVLLLAKSRFNNLRGNQPVTDSTTISQNIDLPVIIDSDPEILDEVFEEYIREELCPKPSQEETDEYSLKQQKLDKLLAKSFMSELKEALIDKHRIMSERESKALQRIYKNVSNNLALNTEDEMSKNFIPAAPPMPPYFIWSTLSSNEEPSTSDKKLISFDKIENITYNSPIRKKIEESDEENDFIKTLKHKKISNVSSNAVCENNDTDFLMPLSQILLETQVTQFDVKLPAACLQEETFEGSGENSEDEIANEIK